LSTVPLKRTSPWRTVICTWPIPLWPASALATAAAKIWSGVLAASGVVAAAAAPPGLAVATPPGGYSAATFASTRI